MRKPSSFALLQLGMILLGIGTAQADPVWVYKGLTECPEHAPEEVDQLPSRQLEEEKGSLERLGIPVISSETNLKVSEGVIAADAPCKSVDRTIWCYLIDREHLNKARRAGFKASLGRYKDCGRVPQKLRVH